MPNRRSSTKKSQGALIKASPQPSSPQHPPVFDAALSSKHRFRFQASAPLVNTIIGTANLLGLLKMAVTATSAQSLLTAVRIKRVAIWGPPAADLVPVTTSIEYSVGTGAANIGNRPRVFSDTSVGSTRVAAVSISPDPQSAASMWQLRQTTATTNGAVFILNGPANSIVDVDMDVVIQNGETASAAAVTVGATVGVIYADALDNGGLLVPLSWPVLP